MNFFRDIYTFIKCLGFVDITFFIAVITLLILIVTLIYFIKINKDDPLDENDFFPPAGNKKDEDNKKDEMINKVDNTEIKETNEKVNNEEITYNDEEGELLDLEGLTKKLQEDKLAGNLSCDSYEKDQEEKAIISYDELLQRQNKYAVNYEKEEMIDDLVVKKVDLNDLVNKDEQVKIKEVRVISYEKEEAFLNALKELNSLLN